MVETRRHVDPLLLLRKAAMANQKVKLIDDIMLEFDGQLVNKAALCGYKLGLKEPFMDIGSVWYMFKEISGDKPYTADTAKKRGYKYIGVANRGDLCDYLIGRVEQCKGLVQEVLDGRKRPAGEDRETRNKRFKLAPPKDDTADSNAGDPTGRSIKQSDICHADVLARVRPVQDLDVLVRCPGRIVPNADLILKIAQDEVNNWHLPVHRRAPDMMQADGGRVPFIKELEKMLQADPKAKPIILVPCNKRAPINILNAVNFLQDGRYEVPSDEKTRFFESTRGEYVDVVRNIGGRMWTFEVRDSAKNFTKAHWLRVVAIIADGTAWQFKGWPFESIVDVFTSCKGVFFREIGTLTPLHVVEWAVTVLEMGTVQFQHRFSEMRDQFWVEVERFLNNFRTKKFVNHTTLDTVQLSKERPLPVL